MNCKNIVWAVLDSGIDAKHAAFADQDKPDRSRVRKTFDFTRICEIVSNDEDDIAPAELEELAQAAGIETAAASDYLKEIAEDAKAKRPINWGVVEKLITLKNPPPPVSPHGTHVAGIIGANGKNIDEKNRRPPRRHVSRHPAVRLPRARTNASKIPNSRSSQRCNTFAT